MTAETDLLPCPGCNGPNTRVIGGPGTRGGPKYWAGCDQCRWRTWGNTEAEAIAAWNRRAQAPEIEALRAEVETLRDGLDYLRQMQGVPDVLELRAKAARAERLAEALREAKDRMLEQVKWVACDCGCEGEKPADAVSIAWLRASTLLHEQEEGK